MTHRHPRAFHTAGHTVRQPGSPLGWIVTALAAFGFVVMAWNGQRCLDGCEHLEHQGDAPPAAVAVADF